MTPPDPYPGWSDPHEVTGAPAPWRNAPANRLSPSPKRLDLSAHDNGYVSEQEDALREEMRALMRKYVDAGLPAHRAKVAVCVGAVVELMAMRSRVERKRYEARVARNEGATA